MICVANFAASFQVGRYGLWVAGRPSRTACRDGGPVSPAVGPVLPPKRPKALSSPVLRRGCLLKPKEKFGVVLWSTRRASPIAYTPQCHCRRDRISRVGSRVPDAGPWGARLDTSHPKAYFPGQIRLG